MTSKTFYNDSSTFFHFNDIYISYAHTITNVKILLGAKQSIVDIQQSVRIISLNTTIMLIKPNQYIHFESKPS